MIGSYLRLLPNFTGKQRLAKMLLGNKLKNVKDIKVEGKYDCTFFLPNIIENIGFDIYINGVYEKETIDFLIKNIPQHKIFVDLGANIGAISFPVCKKRMDIQALCVEAAPWIYEILKYNKTINSINNASLINKAIYHISNNEISFYTPQQEFGKGSFLPFFSKQKSLVETINLGDLIKDFNYEEIGFIKIDIEGYEYFAFKGAADFLSSPKAPDILFEFVDWAEGSVPDIEAGAAQNLLRLYGYSIFGFNNGEVTKKLSNTLTQGTHMFFASKRF